MKRFVLWLCLVAGISGVGMGQGILVRGQVTDKTTGQPVVAANIQLPDGTGTYSGAEGSFEIRVPAFPVVLNVSHITYGKTVVKLDRDPGGPLIIELDELVEEIGEVQITARRLRILTEQKDFSIQDFAFDHKNLWLLGYTNNQGSKGKLWLANWFGDTITSVPVTRAESLYRDVFGDVHLIMKDSVYQLFASDKQIKFPYAVDREEFFRLMQPIRAGFAGKLVYVDIYRFEKLAKIYYRDGISPRPQVLTIVQDQLGRLTNMLDSIVGSMWLDFAARYPVKRGSKVREMIDDPVKAPVFSWRDTLFVIDQYKDSLLSFGPDGTFKRSVPFTYCKDEMLGGIDGGVQFKKISVLADPVGRGLYLLEHRKTIWTLLPLDTNTGQVSSQVMLPEYPGMFRITVFGNAVYFLYPEKKYPYYVRLFRYQM